MQSSSSTKQSTFTEDVLAGLTSTPKSLSSKYFYDDEGSRLFMEIMKLPEYYLTQLEFEIFSEQTAAIFDAFTAGVSEFDLIELGAGDGTKTAVLIDHFLKQGIDFTYTPIDISKEACEALSAKFHVEFPELKIDTRHGDYFRILETLQGESSRRKILLFLGSNIGNFNQEQAVDFFKQIRSAMNDNDLLFIGFDLQKDPHIILNAYDDSQGVTAAFNLNLLNRMNREMGADFDVSKFSHYAMYRPVECAARSFLISREKQTVYIEALNQSFDFDQWEATFMEISQKFSLAMIKEISAASGFEITQTFFDSKNYYCDSLWRPV
ncbi:MAG: L-histidine N(alpha)-methyltransferase [Pyrinomonadaceae bacterium]